MLILIINLMIMGPINHLSLSIVIVDCGNRNRDIVNGGNQFNEFIDTQNKENINRPCSKVAVARSAKKQV
jgi:hypothetical protein